MATRWELHDGAAQTGPLDEDHVVRMIGAGLPATTMVRPEGDGKYRPIGSHLPFAEGFQRLARSQAASVAAAPSLPREAAPSRRMSKIDTTGGGCFAQGLGVLIGLMAFGSGAKLGAEGILGGAVLGLTIMLGGLVVGRRFSTKWSCEACGNPISGPEVRLCPTCRAPLAGNATAPSSFSVLRVVGMLAICAFAVIAIGLYMAARR